MYFIRNLAEGEPALEKILLQELMRHTRHDWDALLQAWQAEQWRSLRDTLHRMQGVAAMLEFHPLVGACSVARTGVLQARLTDSALTALRDAHGAFVFCVQRRLDELPNPGLA